MIRVVIKWVTVCFLLIYVNRGLFIASVETDFNSGCEINSVAEWLLELVTGQSNNLDEDGNSHDTCNSHQTLQIFTAHQVLQMLEMWNKPAADAEKIFFPVNESIPDLYLVMQIDHPPKQA
jgi:hypothetical protein